MNRVVITCFSLLGIAIIIAFVGVKAQSTTGNVNGIPLQGISVTGMQTLYNPNGTIITNGRCVQSIVTSAATTGLWSVDYTAMGFTAVTSFRAEALSPSSSTTLLSNEYIAHINSVTNTLITGTVTNNTNVLVATVNVPIIQFGSTAAQVSVGVCGS